MGRRPETFSNTIMEIATRIQALEGSSLHKRITQSVDVINRAIDLYGYEYIRFKLHAGTLHRAGCLLSCSLIVQDARSGAESERGKRFHCAVASDSSRPVFAKRSCKAT